MFGTIKRVISDPEELGSKEGKISKTEAHPGTMERGDITSESSPPKGDDASKNLVMGTITTPYPTLATKERSPPAVIESDEHTDDVGQTDAPVHLVAKHMSSNSTTSSSLSDHSATGALLGEEEDAKVQGNDDAIHADASSPNDMPAANLHRTIAEMPRASSQMSHDSSELLAMMSRSTRDSSGNWGWFEDVHGPFHSSSDLLKEAGEDSALKKGKKRTIRGGGLLHQFNFNLGQVMAGPLAPQQVENATSMAVTAPTYVLEESLSSQKLWKHTAGNRPPQPVEERAFYEKMWAQNFERSQVDYKIPVEILTASSPISLSPFADAQFSNYTLASGDHDSPSTGKPKITGAGVAEAALMNRLHDPRPKDYGGSTLGGKPSQKLVNKIVKGTESEGDLTVLVKGDNVFGTTVSKSFSRPGANSGVDTVNISVASYRVVESKKNGKYAQYLVIYREGSFRDTVGIWKRFSDFSDLSHKIAESHEGCSSVLQNMSPLAITEEHEIEHLPNAITSWRLLKKRQRWYRCLDAGYLSLKVFLLERFLHDILFESTSPDILRDFCLGTTTDSP